MYINVPIAGELINIWIKGQNLRVGFKKKKSLIFCEKFWHSQLNVHGFLVTIQTEVGKVAIGNVNHDILKKKLTIITF